ncbi:MAG: TrkH family potassium uptake protein [Hyphomicrobiaceae bacterium]|nr:TrkH family potassium uptake protein [Hyphomicrobiaceae bacterium]
MTIVGALLATLGVTMMIPALVDAAVANPDWQVFAVSSLITLMIGLGLTATGRGRSTVLGARQAIVMTVAAWTILPAFAAFPFLWSETVPHYTDAFFEAMSGLSTTGATVIVGLDTAPPGILLWRSLLQWLGGLGVIVMAVAVLPMLQVGGLQLFKAEAFETPEKIMPRATQISGSLTLIFAAFTALCAFAYMVAGMGAFDAVNHAMTTVATGGFSTKDASIGHFQSFAVDVVAIVFMVIGSLPFLLYVQALRGQPGALIRDEQVRGFFFILGAAIAAMTAAIAIRGHFEVPEALRHAMVNVISVMTGTGYATHDYNGWGPFAVALFLTLTFIGGCAGSTACGMKVFRIQVAAKVIGKHVRQITYPNGVFHLRFNDRALQQNVISSVMAFLFLFFGLFSMLAIALVFTGMDTISSISGAATAIANVGPGLGEAIGPASNFKEVPLAAKWLMSVGMLIGRLEIFTVLVLFVPRFWAN